jgi:hypothetical protein
MYGSGRCYLVLATLVAISATLLCAGCGGGGVAEDLPKAIMRVDIVKPTRIIGGVEQQWTVTTQLPDRAFGGFSNWYYEPYTISWDFGGGAAPNVVTTAGEEWDTNFASVMMLNDRPVESGSYTATVTITDSRGSVVTKSVDYTIGPAYEQLLPGTAAYDASTHILAVSASADERAMPVSFRITNSLAVVSNVDQQETVQYPPTAEFTLAANDIWNGWSGTLQLEVMDGMGHTASMPAQLTIPAAPVQGGTLYVAPVQERVEALDYATVVVATGRPVYAFRYTAEACVTFPDWVHYARYSLNPGLPGGSGTEPDGVWGPGGVGALSVYVTPEQDMREQAVPGASGRNYVSCRVQPLGGNASYSCTGALLNFAVTFNHTGTASFGLLPPDTGAVDRTFYSDEVNTAHAWDTLSAGPDGVLSVAGIGNKIEVY